MVVIAVKPALRHVETRGSRGPGLSWIYSKSEGSLGYKRQLKTNRKRTRGGKGGRDRHRHSNTERD